MEVIFEILKYAEEVLFIIANIVCLCIMAKTLYESISLLLKRKNHEAKTTLINGINLTLTFNLACEVLDIIVLKEFHEITLVGGILLLKLLIAFLLHCEDKWEHESEGHKTKKKAIVAGKNS